LSAIAGLPAVLLQVLGSQWNHAGGYRHYQHGSRHATIFCQLRARYLPVGGAILAVALAQVFIIIGYDIFSWAIPCIRTGSLWSAFSLVIVILTWPALVLLARFLVGMQTKRNRSIGRQNTSSSWYNSQAKFKNPHAKW
jgi:hypothetical protein